jgi:hypothetical protein
MSELMSIRQLNFMLRQIALQSGLPTVEAVFDGSESLTSARIKIVLGTNEYYVPVKELIRDYDFEWLFKAADALRRGEK